jgi:hypothetical protein
VQILVEYLRGKAGEEKVPAFALMEIFPDK